MKKFVISLSAFLLVACSNTGNVERKETDYNINPAMHLDIIIIDGCEYLYGAWGDGRVLTHKGNCKNHKK